MATNRQLPHALSVCKRKVMHQAMQPVPTHNIQQHDQSPHIIYSNVSGNVTSPPHIKYSNVTSRWPVGDQSPSQPHKLEKFTIRLKMIRWNTPLYNLTKNMNIFHFLLKLIRWNTSLYHLTKNTNTFPFFAEIDKVEHSTI